MYDKIQVKGYKIKDKKYPSNQYTYNWFPKKNKSGPKIFVCRGNSQYCKVMMCQVGVV